MYRKDTNACFHPIRFAAFATAAPRTSPTHRETIINTFSYAHIAIDHPFRVSSRTSSTQTAHLSKIYVPEVSLYVLFVANIRLRK